MSQENTPGQEPHILTPQPYLPFGLLDLDPNVRIDPGPPLRMKCFIQGCERFLQPPARGYWGEVCREHGIRVHRSNTFSYRDPRRNTIINPGLLARIIHHPFKFESRFHLERSEDQVSLCVFRSFQEAHALNLIARFITGLEIDKEPRVFLWGLELTNDSLTPFELLIAARNRFESKLPVKRPGTEPDIMLYLPGAYLALLEAKFCSPNTYYADGPRKDNQSLTKNELLNIYSDPMLRILDRDKAAQADRVYYQLWRNMVFSEWMARSDGLGTQPYLVSLTRAGYENESCEHFAQMIRPEYRHHFSHLTWEELYVLAGLKPKLSTLRQYLLTKTANLLPAFKLPY